MYDIHGSEEGFQNGFNPNNIDPNEIFKMFFQQAGGDPFANLFGGSSSFTMYSNTGGSQFFRSGGGTNTQQRRRQEDPLGAAGVNIFDLLNGGGMPQQRRRPQRQAREEQNPFDIFEHQRQQRGRKNQAAKERQPENKAVVLNVFNNCMP
mmetsp:Transcript_17549/g.19743  ORF Transcript_17549/g.19743 Transcript_17549/m.19743 type:complete len:150 (-) Transcript_17549:79-528(-)|eukprot:CAMPEP_0205830224 /NCGR_PEP_ID=MMETSP0206-20130828/40437_1 /ASSEMBLY_ACC=CAM_ASM_000279 /TAXON_ID=36767 /ORGANISM="Euplotes focardii, Strain TN1" /LENGTH=149 /DNA_ID=CAMNT_0053133669 /DNA_START=207 /DNA_END=656 /DNA_ORIENTATION=+